MPEKCEHGGTWREDGSRKSRACALITSISGMSGVHVPAEQCAECSGSFAATAANYLLAERISVDWAAAAASCKTCGGSAITLEEACRRLAARDAATARRALLSAVTRYGMPKKDAWSLAARHLPGDKALESSIDAAQPGEIKPLPCKDCGEKKGPKS